MPALAKDSGSKQCVLPSQRNWCPRPRTEPAILSSAAQRATNQATEDGARRCEVNKIKVTFEKLGTKIAIKYIFLRFIAIELILSPPKLLWSL